LAVVVLKVLQPLPHNPEVLVAVQAPLIQPPVMGLLDKASPVEIRVGMVAQSKATVVVAVKLGLVVTGDQALVVAVVTVEMEAMPIPRGPQLQVQAIRAITLVAVAVGEPHRAEPVEMAVVEMAMEIQLLETHLLILVVVVVVLRLELIMVMAVRVS
jgi:hypothetical protein